MIDYTQMKVNENESKEPIQKKAPHTMPHSNATKQRISETMQQRHKRLKMLESFVDNIDSPKSYKILEKRFMQLERQLREDIKRVTSTSKNLVAILKLLPQFQEDNEQTKNLAPINNSERFIEEVTRKAIDNFKKIITEKYTIENEQDIRRNKQ